MKHLGGALRGSLGPARRARLRQLAPDLRRPHARLAGDVKVEVGNAIVTPAMEL